MTPSARLKASNIPVCGKLEETGDAVVVGVDVDVIPGVFDTIGVLVLVGVIEGEIATVGVKALVGVIADVFAAVGVKVMSAVIEGIFVTVGVPEEAGTLISYILPSMMLGLLLLSIPRSTM
jgi:hypothetical protein